jgi:hypothetical protein
MADFLSPEWLAELDAVLRGLDPSVLGPLVIEQVVEGVPGRGEVRYRLAVRDGRVRARGEDGDVPAGAPTAAVRFTTDYPTAVALARGTENAQHALGAGRLRLGGEITAMISNADGLAQVADVTATLRAVTTYPGV